MAIKLSTGLRKRLLGEPLDLTVNGNFTTDVTGWTATNSTPTSTAGGFEGNCLTLTASTVAVGQLYQDITVTVGQVYRFNTYFKRGTAASGSYRLGTTATPTLYFTSAALIATSWTQYSTVFIPTDASLRVTLQTDTATIGTNSLFDKVEMFMVSGGFADIFSECYLSIFDSVNPTPTQPASPDDAITDNELIRLTLNSTTNGFAFSKTTFNTYAVKEPLQIISGAALASGDAKYFRLYRKDESPLTSSTSFARLDGTIGNLASNEDLKILNTTLGTESVAVNSLQFTIPTQLTCP